MNHILTIDITMAICFLHRKNSLTLSLAKTGETMFLQFFDENRLVAVSVVDISVIGFQLLIVSTTRSRIKDPLENTLYYISQVMH